MSSPGARGGWSTQILTQSNNTNPGEQNTMRYELLTGVQRAQENRMDATSADYRNFRRSQGRTPSTRGVVGS